MISLQKDRTILINGKQLQYFKNCGNTCAIDCIMFMFRCLDFDLPNDHWLLTETNIQVQKRICTLLKISEYEIKSITEIWGKLCDTIPSLQFPVYTKFEKSVDNKSYDANYLLPLNINAPDQFLNQPKWIVYGHDTESATYQFENVYDRYVLRGLILRKGAHYVSIIYGGSFWYFYDDLRENVNWLNDKEVQQLISQCKIQIMIYIQK